MSSVRLVDVSVSFDGLDVLERAQLSVESGEVVALLGPSGSGKSTLLRVIAGITVPQRGSVMVGGVDMSGVPTHRRGVGMVFQDNQLFPHLSVGDNVAFGLKVAGLPARERRRHALDWLNRVGLDGMDRRGVGELSGGEAKRVALARTLAAQPAVVLLDEPLTGLDRELHDRLTTDLSLLLRDTEATAILVTHDVAEATTVATRVVEIGEINRASPDPHPDH